MKSSIHHLKIIKNPVFSTLLLCSFTATVYLLLVIRVIKEPLLIPLAPLIFFSSFHTVGFLRKQLFTYKLNRDFLDFITILMSLESNGLGLSDLFLMACKDEIRLPSVYKELAEAYTSIEAVTGSSYKALSILAKSLPSSKIKNFLEGYVGILETTGNTLEYIESYIDAELSKLEDAMNNLLNMVENFYEAYLVILLSIIMLSSFPSISSLTNVIYLILMLLGFGGYFAAGFISEKLYYEEPMLFTFLSLLLITLMYIFLRNNMFIPTIILVTVFTLSSHVFWKKYYLQKHIAEEHVYELSEDIYMESNQGFSLDIALMNLSYRATGYSWIARELAKLIKLGIKGYYIDELLKLTPLSKKILNLLLSPLEITSSKGKHVGYVLKFFRRIRSIRENLSNRIKTLYAYVLLLPPTVYAIAYALKTMNISEYLPVDPSIIPGYVLLSSVSAWLVANKIARGYGLIDVKILLVLLENLVLYLWLIL